MAIELRIIIQGTKELNGVSLNQVNVRAIGPLIFGELSETDQEVRNAEMALAQALQGPLTQLLRPQKGQIIKPGFLKSKEGKRGKRK